MLMVVGMLFQLVSGTVIWGLGEVGMSGGEVLDLLDVFPVYDGVEEVEGVKNEGDIVLVVDGMADDRDQSRDGDMEADRCALVESQNEVDEGGSDEGLDISLNVALT
jgi:hypothetical protein